MKHFRKHFRSHGKHNHNGHLPSQREEDLDKQHPFHSKRGPFRQHSDSKIGLATLGSSNSFIKGFPELSILSNNDVIYDTSIKSNENTKALDDISDDYDGQNYNYLDNHHHKTRHPRSVLNKVKGSLLSSSFRKLSPPARDQAVTEENLTNEESDKSDESHFDEILSTSSNTNGAGSSSSPPSGPSASISEAIPTNSGVTKIEINLSFGCLFFCE